MVVSNGTTTRYWVAYNWEMGWLLIGFCAMYCTSTVDHIGPVCLESGDEDVEAKWPMGAGKSR